MLAEVLKTTVLTVSGCVFVCIVRAYATCLLLHLIPDVSEHHSTSAA